MPADTEPSSFPPELIALSQAALDAEQLGTENEPTVETVLPAKEGADAPAPTPAAETPAKDNAATTQDGKEQVPAQADSSLKESDKKPDEKPKSKYAQERERLNLTWEKVNAEKAAFKAQQEKFAQEAEARRLEAIKSQPFRDENGNTAADYAAFAKTAAERGETALAEQAKAAAQRVQQLEYQAKQVAGEQELQMKWIKNYESHYEKYPDLNNQQSEMFKAVKQLIAENPLLQRDPSGANLAIRAYEINQQYQKALQIQEENKKLTSTVAELQKKLSLSSGVATEMPKADKPFADKSEKEQRRELLNLLTENPEY